MEPLLFFLAGCAAGAACMWASNRRAAIAAREERARSDRRMERIAGERNA